MIRMWHKIEQDARLIKLLIGMIAAQTIIIGLLWLGWYKSPENLTIHVPPSLDSSATIKSGAIPESALYAFSYYIWQSFNNWPHDGETDYPENLHNYSYLITPRFREQLAEHFNSLIARGEVQGRIRTIRGALGAAYDRQNVAKLGKDTWEVKIIVRVNEYVRGVLVKDVEIEYPLRVIRYDINREYNPWGLALDGFTAEPKRITAYSIEKEAL